MTKVYLAVSGEYSDYRVANVFARREDAENYPLADGVEERELQEGPVEVRNWNKLWWHPGQPDKEGLPGYGMPNPYEDAHELRDFDGDERHCEHSWVKQSQFSGVQQDLLTVEGWDPKLVRKVYSEQRARYLAGQEGVT